MFNWWINSKLIDSIKLKNESRLNEKAFTRNRKVGFVTLVLMIMNMVKKSTQLEIDDFFKQFSPEGISNITYTKQSFSEARQKLSPKAFVILNDGFVEKFYEDGDFKTYKGYRLLAIDGCSIEVPNNSDTRKHFGHIENQSKKLKLARALSSKVYDVENKILVSSILGRCDDHERDLALKNIDDMQNIGGVEIKDLILFDRGYPSLAFFMQLIERDKKFLIRAGLSSLEDIQNTKALDECIEVTVTKERWRRLKKQGIEMPIGSTVKLRILKVKLDSGDTEMLVTNLNEDELKYEESKELYFKRWGIETKFDELKNKFEIERFSGEKPILVEQDFYATILLSNIASIFEQEAEEELKEQNATKNLKHEYKINKSILIGKLKDNLIEILLEDDEEKKTVMYENFVQEIKRNCVPVIKGRTYERQKIIKANKYSKSRRRVL